MTFKLSRAFHPAQRQKSGVYIAGGGPEDAPPGPTFS